MSRGITRRMPIPLEVLKRVSVVYTHAHCPDGLASAMILKDAFRMLGMSPRIEFLAHGTKEHEVAGREVGRTGDDLALFCDIAPSTKCEADHALLNTATWASMGKHAVVLDHHVGAKDVVEQFGELGVYADAEKEPGVSGAVLAFREVWEPVWNAAIYRGIPVVSQQANRNVVEDFSKCVGARDCWQTQDSRFIRGQWISKMLMARPAAYWLREGGDPYLTDLQVDIGMELFAQHQEAVRQAVQQVVHSFVEDGGRASTGTGFGDVHTGVTLYTFQEQASGFRLTSDVAESIRTAGEQQDDDHHGVVAGFAYAVDKPGASPRLVYSLRGLGGFDVCAFAKANGGGGHKTAAGFSMALRAHGGVTQTDPYEEVCRRLETFLICGAGTRS